MGIGFQEASDVGEVLLPFAGTPRGVCGRPDLAPEDILDLGDRKAEAENLAHAGAFDELPIAGIGLQLNAKIRARVRDVHAVRESFDCESLEQRRFRLLDLGPGNGQIEGFSVDPEASTTESDGEGLTGTDPENPQG